jgi:hypothetical protein
VRVQSAAQLYGFVVVDPVGRRVGVIQAATCSAADPYTARWALVSLGMWRARQRMIPLTGADWRLGEVIVPNTRETIVGLPRARARHLRDPRAQQIVDERCEHSLVR